MNAKNEMISDSWDGVNLRITCRRCVNDRVMNLWLEVVSITESICFGEEEDDIIWNYHSSGLFIFEVLSQFTPLLCGNCLSLLEFRYFFGFCLIINCSPEIICVEGKM